MKSKTSVRKIVPNEPMTMPKTRAGSLPEVVSWILWFMYISGVEGVD